MSRTVLGHSVERTEDAELLRGTARYVDDLAGVTGALWAVFVRSMVAHGELRAVELSGARAAPGVLGVLAADDLDLPSVPALGGDGALDRPLLARSRVRFVGEPVAVVVARTRADAADAAEQVVVDIEPFEPVVDPFVALRPDAPRLFPDFGWNTTMGPVPAAHATGYVRSTRAISIPVAMSHTRAVRSRPVVMRWRPSSLKRTSATMPACPAASPTVVSTSRRHRRAVPSTLGEVISIHGTSGG